MPSIYTRKLREQSDRLPVAVSTASTCNSVSPKIILTLKERSLSEPERSTVSSIKPISQFVDELLIGNELVYRQTDRPTDRATDRPTSSKTISPLVFEGGHKNEFKMLKIEEILLRLMKNVLDMWVG
ncbi:hypothetical protein DPMN_108641 [Dreissena polymorpha]|uniref:Uncharacterized protein n=1 Tax=Dreissena polymorpha TaxID=45954 RepID=A0A9D4QL70_DREPO|nr:hypothetical protein DPMN_108641 [Dreissena polymorpha]